MSIRNFIFLLGISFALSGIAACNSNKVACPTYADSFPDKKAKKGKQKPDVPKYTKPKSSVLPPGYGKKK